MCIRDSIIELRSLTMGVGTFTWSYDHLQEVPDKVKSKVLTTNGKGKI